MPNTIWDEDAVPILWHDCRRRTPDCTADMILRQVSNKLRMKGWERIQNPVGFLLTSVPKAVEAAASASNRHDRARVEDEIASARREAEKRLQREKELAAWEQAEQAFEALSHDKKQYLVNQERQRLLREHPEYRDRVQLPGWQKSFHSRAIKAFLANSSPALLDVMVPASEHDGGTDARHRNGNSETGRNVLRLWSALVAWLRTCPPSQRWPTGNPGDVSVRRTMHRSGEASAGSLLLTMVPSLPDHMKI
jgi:hypothetical protein